MDGQLGDGGGGDQAVIPRQLDGLLQVRHISMGQGVAGLLMDAGPPQAWGANNQGQLGRGTMSAFETDRLPISGL